MRSATWCLLAAAACSAPAIAQQPWPGYYYPPSYPQRAYYQNPYPTYYPPVQQVQALHGMRGPYPAMGVPANAYYAPRPTMASTNPPGIAAGGWDLNYYAPNPNMLSKPSYNVPEYGMPVVMTPGPRTPAGTSWPAPVATNYPLPGGDMIPDTPPAPVPFHRPTKEVGWFSADYIMGFARPMRTPGALATIGNPNDPSPGAIGQPGTVATFGADSIDFGISSGFRVNVGCFLDSCDRYSVELDGLFTSPTTESYFAASDGAGNPVLARPFFRVNAGPTGPGERSFVDSFPGTITGSQNFVAKSQLTGGEVNFRAHGYTKERLHYDGLLGLRYLRLSESLVFQHQNFPLAINQLNFLNSPVNPPNSLRLEDQFRTSNQFAGLQVGGRGTWEGSWWTLTGYGKVGFGVTQQRVGIDGSSTLVTPNGNTVAQGNLFALPSNIGQYSRNVFGILGELGVNFGVNVTDHVRLKLGYSIILWDHVVRPAGQIDRNVNTGQVPYSTSFGTATGPSNPFFRFNDEFYWVNFLTFGLEAHY